jgi:hypothetical protein
MDRNQIFKDLAEFVNDDDSASPKKLDNLKLWEILLDVAANESKTLSIFFEIFLSYVDKAPEFREVDSPELAKLIATLQDQEKPLEERSKAAIPLIVVSPFVTPAKAAAITTAAIDVCQKLIEKENDLPIKYLDNFDDMMCGDMSPEVLKDVYDAFKAQIAGPNKAAAIACFAPVSQDIAEIFEEEIKVINGYILDAFKGDIILKKAGAFLLEYITGFYEEEPESCTNTKEFLDVLVPMMNDENASAAKRAERAFQSLIEAHIFDEKFTKELLDLFPKFTTPLGLKYYFKLLTCFVAPEEDDCCCGGDCCCDHEEHEPNLTVVQAFLTFCMDKLKAAETSSLVKGHCLDLLSVLASLNKMFIEDDYKTALAVAVTLVNEGKADSFPWLSAFLVAVVKCFGEPTKEIIKPTIPVLIDACEKNESITGKDKNNLLADICAIVGEGFNDDVVEKITNITVDLLDSKDLKTLFSACACVIALRPKLSADAATVAFKKVAGRLDEMEEENDVNTLIHTLKKLMKKTAINADVVYPTVEKILKGNLKVLNGRLPIEDQPPNEIYFVFLSAFISKYPGKAEEVCKTVIQWLEKAQISAMTAILDTLTCGLDVCAIKEPEAKQITTFLKEFINKLTFQDANEYAAVLSCLTSINKSFPGAAKPYEPIFEPIVKLVQAIAATDEEEDFQTEAITAMPDVAKFVFNVYATDSEVEVNEDLLGSLVSMMPFSPEVECVPGLLQDLVDMLEDTERFESIVLPTLKCFTDLLLMKKSELEEFELEDDLVKAMKATLKAICKKTPAIGKQITKDFQSSRAKVNRFNALIR